MGPENAAGGGRGVVGRNRSVEVNANLLGFNSARSLRLVSFRELPYWHGGEGTDQVCLQVIITPSLTIKGTGIGAEQLVPGSRARRMTEKLRYLMEQGMPDGRGLSKLSVQA